MLRIKKTITAGIAFALSAVLAVSGVVMAADAVQDNQVQKSVDIEQVLYKWDHDDLVPQTSQDAMQLVPYVGNITGYNTPNGYPAKRRLAANNVADKYVSVKNIGSDSVYVRTIFAFEMGEVTEENFSSVIGMTLNVSDAYPGSDSIKQNWVWDNPFVTQIDGKNYMIMAATFQQALAPDAETIPSLLQVYLDKASTNDTVEKLDGNKNGKYDILMVSQAVSVSWTGNQTEVKYYSTAEETFNHTLGNVTQPYAKDLFENVLKSKNNTTE